MPIDHPTDPSDADLARYLSRECRADEAAAIERWIEADPSHQRVVQELRQLWDEADRVGPRWETGRMWGALTKRIETQPAGRGSGRPLLRAPGRTRGWQLARSTVWVPIAASALLTAGAALWLARMATKVNSPGAAMREVVTAAGQRAEVRLADGSRVILGVETRLRFPLSNTAKARDVELFGEAYFEVTHDPRRPFRVRAGGTLTEDLGTDFVVRAYPGDPDVRVAVAAGEVVVRRESDEAPLPATLRRGDVATLGSAGMPTVVHVSDLEPYLAWTRGRITFHGTRLADAVRELSRWYAVEIRFGHSGLDSLRVTASFRDESIAEVLHLLGASLNLRSERSGEVITLFRN